MKKLAVLGILLMLLITPALSTAVKTQPSHTFKRYIQNSIWVKSPFFMILQRYFQKTTQQTVWTIDNRKGDFNNSQDTFNDTSTDNPTEVNTLTPEELNALMSSDNSIVIVDVRDNGAYNSGHIPGSFSIPFYGCGSCFVAHIKPFRGNRIISYSSDGTVGEAASKLLLENGFEEVYNLDGGIEAWCSCGFTVTSSQGSNSNRDNSHHPLGHLPIDTSVKPDDTRTVSVTDVPSHWDWRKAEYNGVKGNWMTSVKNQGHCGSCWAFAADGALEAIINIKNNNPDLDMDLSEQYLLSCGGWGCDASNAYYAYQFMYKVGGTVPESCFPYQARGDIPCDSICPDWRSKIIPITGFGYWRNPGREFIQSKLIELGPLCVSMRVYTDFQFYDGGVYRHRYGNLEGSHQVVLVGYDNDKGYWICKNSWGKKWGENGWFKIAYGECGIEEEVVYVKYEKHNFPPETPEKPYGPTNGAAGVEYTYSTVAVDPDNDKIYYLFDWGDDTDSGWLGPFKSGVEISATHIWKKEGYYDVKVKVKDYYGEESKWSASLTVTIDATAPKVEILSPEDGYLYLNGRAIFPLSSGKWNNIVVGDMDFEVSAYDECTGVDHVEMIYNGGVFEMRSKGDNKWFFPIYNGVGTYRAHAVDRVGYGQYSEERRILTYLGNSPPFLVYDLKGQSNVKPNTYCTYSTSVIDVEGDNVYYRFHWGDGSKTTWRGPVKTSRVTPYGNERVYLKPSIIKASHKWSKEGKYTVTLEVKDSQGNKCPWELPLVVTVEEENMKTPTAVVKGPYEITRENPKVTFDASESHDNDENGREIKWIRWDFDGDGNWDTGSKLTGYWIPFESNKRITRDFSHIYNDNNGAPSSVWVLAGNLNGHVSTKTYYAKLEVKDDEGQTGKGYVQVTIRY